MRRVAVTGLGIVAPVGTGIEEAWRNALAGKSGIAKISLFDASNLNVRIAGEVDDPDLRLDGVIDVKEVRRLSRYIKLAVLAAHEAVTMAGEGVFSDPLRCGCAIGVGLGALDEIEKSTLNLDTHGQKKVSPFFIPYAIPNMATGIVAKCHDLQGVNLAPTAACASGSHGIGEAFRAIKYGYSDVMVCGGAESAISPLGIASFANMRALSSRNDDPPAASRPFERDRDGFVTGEGAGMLVLEELEQAKARGALIIAELRGYGNNGDAWHITAPRPQGAGMRGCMQLALQEARLAPDQITYVNAHGTSTPLNDRFESEAIGALFGEHAHQLSISSTKSVTGHCLGAAGGIEAVFTVLAVRDGIMPPTINLDQPDEHCPFNYIPHHAQERVVKHALSNSFGFGGVNASLIFSRWHS